MNAAEVLVVRDNGWLLGLDATHVYSIQRHDRIQSVRLSSIFEEHDNALGENARTFALKGCDTTFSVDRVQGTIWFESRDLYPLPTTLRALGVPPCITGHAWTSDHHLVLLLDPRIAFSSRPHR